MPLSNPDETHWTHPGGIVEVLEAFTIGLEDRIKLSEVILLGFVMCGTQV